MLKTDSNTEKCFITPYAQTYPADYLALKEKVQVYHMTESGEVILLDIYDNGKYGLYHRERSNAILEEDSISYNIVENNNLNTNNLNEFTEKFLIYNDAGLIDNPNADTNIIKKEIYSLQQHIVNYIEFDLELFIRVAQNTIRKAQKVFITTDCCDIYGNITHDGAEVIVNPEEIEYAYNGNEQMSRTKTIMYVFN